MNLGCVKGEQWSETRKEGSSLSDSVGVLDHSQEYLDVIQEGMDAL